MKLFGKKGLSLNMVPGVVVLLVVIAIVLSIGSTVTQDVRDDNAANSYAYNASNAGLIGISKVANWQDNWGTIIGAAVIIALVMGAFVFATKR